MYKAFLLMYGRIRLHLSVADACKCRETVFSCTCVMPLVQL